MTATAPELTEASQAFLARRPLGERRRLGQYLTPRPLRDALLDRVPVNAGDRVLDPGVGTGEFLLSVREREPRAVLEGWDVDAAALAVARDIVPQAMLHRRSALEVDVEDAFDVVVGNPPYFQVRLAPEERSRFAAVVSGRPNIFALFFHIGLRALRPGGHLGFVVPPSMNSGAYFQALRDHIVGESTVEFIEVHEAERGHFPDAQTAVQVIVLRKRDTPGRGSRGRHVFDVQDVTDGPLRRTVLTPDPRRLEEAFDGRATLWRLGYEAVTGSVVWNQSRDRLRRRPARGAVPLVWGHNVADRRLDLDPDHPTRPQYVAAEDPLVGPAIVVNRIVGAVGSGRLRCAPIPEGAPFLGENHVNVVRPRQDATQEIGWDRLLDLLAAPGVSDHVAALTGNTQVSATELTHLVPLGPL